MNSLPDNKSHRPRISAEDFRLQRDCCIREGIKPSQFFSEAIRNRAHGKCGPSAKARELAEAREWRRRIALVVFDTHQLLIAAHHFAAESPTRLPEETGRWRDVAALLTRACDQQQRLIEILASEGTEK